MNESKFREFKEKVEEAQASAQRAQGALDQLMKRLKQEFDCDTEEQAISLLEQLRYGCNKAEKKFVKALQEYERKWKGSE